MTAVDNRKRGAATDGVIEPTTKRRANGISHKEYERLRSVAHGSGSIHEAVLGRSEIPEEDPWIDEASDSKKDPKFDFLTKPKPFTPPQTLKRTPISLVAKDVNYPAVPKPRAGRSYNPLFEDWNRLLNEEGEKELEAERRRLEEAVNEQRKIDRMAAAEAEEEDYQTEDESVWEGIDSDYEGNDWLNKRRPERKTQAERNKIKRRKEAAQQQKAESEEKRRTQQVQKIRAIAQDIKEEEEARAAVARAVERTSVEVDEDVILRRRKLGKCA